MAENITTLLDKLELLAANADDTDKLYVVHGTGSDRDKYITLSELMAYIDSNEKFTELKIVKDANNDITIKWDQDNNEFVIWERANTGTVAVPKLHVHGTLLVEKDTTIAADMVVTKSMTVAGRVDLNGNFTVIKNLYSTDYAELHNRTKVERLNAVSDKSYFVVDSDTDIRALLNGNTIQSTVGDIVVIRNSSLSDISVTLSPLYKTTINKLCAMEFICHFVDNNGSDWTPLGNASVVSL